MNRRWIAVAIIVVAIIGIANLFILLVVMPGRSKAAGNPPPAAAPVAAQNPASVPSSGAASAGAVAAAPDKPAPGAVQPVAPAPRHPSPPPIQPGMHVDRQVLTASGNLRILYLRDRARDIREIAFQDAQNPSNQTVLADYKRNAWVVVSPNDDWVILETRDKGDSGVQLYHRVSVSPLKYEVPQELQASGRGLRDVIWQSYLSDTQQDPNIESSRVTIDATSWEPDSQRVSLSVSPVPAKDNSALPIAWTCIYNVNTQSIEPAGNEVAEGPVGQEPDAQPNEAEGGAPDEIATGPDEVNSVPVAENEQAEATAPNEQGQELEGEKFPATREEEITVADANELELTDVKYAIFEMFARHGADIHDVQMRKAFSQFPWYEPRPGVSFDAAEEEFSDVEKHNLAVLRRVRDAKLAAAHRSEPRPIRGERVPEESDGEKFMRGVIQGVTDALGGGGG
jgi:hypothetical protein